MPDLRTRHRVPELMDDPALPAADHRAALAGLARLNRVGSAGLLWPPLHDLAGRLKRPVRVLDVATGGGDIPARLARIARRRGVELDVVGCDLSPTAVGAATAAGVPAFVHDAVNDPLPGRFDVVTCSLFLHHLDDADGGRLLTHMRAAADHLVLVNDLRRSRFSYAAVWAACRLATRSPVVHYDGPASVRSAFTPAEALELAGRAGWANPTVRTAWPCRYLLSAEVS